MITAAVIAFLKNNWRLIAFAGLLVGVAAWGALKMHEHDVVKYEKLEQEYHQFKSDITAFGKAQKRETARIVTQQKAISQAKENADATLITDTIAHNSAVFDELRKRAADPSGSVVPTVSNAPGFPAGAVCFDRDKLDAGFSASVDRFLGQLAPSLQRCEVDAGRLGLARQWVQEQMRANPILPAQ